MGVAGRGQRRRRAAHLALDLLVARQLGQVQALLVAEEGRRRVGVGQPQRVGPQHQLVPHPGGLERER